MILIFTKNPHFRKDGSFTFISEQGNLKVVGLITEARSPGLSLIRPL